MTLAVDIFTIPGVVNISTNLPKLRGRIAELGVRQFDVARRLGIDPAVLSAYLRGHRKPPEDFPQQLTDVLDNMEEADTARQKVLGKGAVA